MLKRLAALALLLIIATLCFPSPSRATDIPINPPGPSFKFPQPLIWGQSGAQGFNNNYFFTPYFINEGVCVYVYNNNPTNVHTFTVSIVVTGNPQSTTPSDGTWQAAASTTASVPVSPGVPGGLGATVSGVSQISVNLSGSTVQAGSPDTASVTIIQTTGNCFAGNGFTTSSPNTITSIVPVQSISDGLSQGFFTSFTATNPATGGNILNVGGLNLSKTIYLDSITLACSVACIINVATAASTTCTTGGGAVPIINLKLGNATNPTATDTSSCTTGPAGLSTFVIVPLGANTPYTFDARGIIIPAFTTQSITIINNTAITGTLLAAFKWYEK
jgi:hypothetical protein